MDAIIKIENADICQNDLHLVLKGVNLTINKGEFVYLIGRVGSGKTSLIRTLNAELPLKVGTGSVAGFDLHKIKFSQISKLRRKLGIVFQDFQLLIDRNVYQNLEFVLKSTGWKNKQQIEDRINEVLNKVGLINKGYKLPHQLSGGEQQRVVIARALLNDPEIILADEPTGNLDPDTSIEIIKLLLQISESGRAVVIATHNYSILKKFPSRTIRCEDSQLTEISHVSEIDFSSLQ